jgi:hypothetical protein
MILALHSFLRLAKGCAGDPTSKAILVLFVTLPIIGKSL